jgi:tRNA A-37 threonylcarbamoyl transferase component Bud32
MAPPAYELVEPLRSSASHLVYRARRRTDGRTVVLKSLASEYRTSRERRVLEQEFIFAQQLAGPGTVAPIELTRIDGTPTLVLADAGASDLMALSAEGAVDVARGLELAGQIADVLARVHQQGLLHRDVTPANVAIDHADRITLLDFEHTVAATRTVDGAAPTPQLAGTLAYLPPEQSGRTALPVDRRSDLYGLGATLFTLFTGRPPFDAANAFELLHAHLARRPERIDALRPDLPSALADVVARLLEKDQARRYQSAEAVARDLRQIAAQLAEGVEPSPPEAVAADGELVLPTRLYGRAEESASIATAIHEVARTGTPRLIEISGAAGIGKSGLLSIIHVPVFANRGWLGFGQYAQRDRTRPYAAISHALCGVVEHLLSLPETDRDAWRDRIARALGGTLPVAGSLVPTLAQLVDVGTTPPDLTSREAERRLLAAAEALVTCLALGEGPVVLVLDNLHWADWASGRMLRHLLEVVRGQMVVVVAYRPGEVDSNHPAEWALGGDLPIPRLQLVLHPLPRSEIEALVADTVGPSIAPALGELIHQKSGGNPFFVHRLLESLHAAGVLSWADGGWRFDEAASAVTPVSENVVDLLLQRMARLPESVRAVLSVGACIGGAFTADELRAGSTGDLAFEASALRAAVDAGLLVSVSPERGDTEGQRYAFTHDKVEEAAYQLLPPEDRAAAHERIGSARAAALTPFSTDAELFAAVDQINRGARPEALDVATRRARARLILEAGRRLTSAAAQKHANAVLVHGVDMLPDDAWRRDPDLAAQLYLGGARAAFDSGDRARAAAGSRSSTATPGTRHRRTASSGWCSPTAGRSTGASPSASSPSRSAGPSAIRCSSAAPATSSPTTSGIGGRHSASTRTAAATSTRSRSTAESSRSRRTRPAPIRWPSGPSGTTSPSPTRP